MKHAMFSAEDVEKLLEAANKRALKLADIADCDHRSMDDYMCIDCGKDRTEEIMSRDFDRQKDLRKYGE